jgi:hypothetical protein
MEMQQIIKMLAKLQASQDDMNDNASGMETKMEAIYERMMAKLNTYQERPMAHPGTTEIDPNPRMTPSAEEYYEIPNKEAAIMPVRGLKKQRRVLNLAAERHQKKQERTRETCGSRKFAAAHRGIAHRARVAWDKRVVVRKNLTHKNFGLPTVLTAARMRIACCARVAWRRGHSHKKYNQNCVAMVSVPVVASRLQFTTTEGCPDTFAQIV